MKRRFNLVIIIATFYFYKLTLQIFKNNQWTLMHFDMMLLCDNSLANFLQKAFILSG